MRTSNAPLRLPPVFSTARANVTMSPASKPPVRLLSIGAVSKSVEDTPSPEKVGAEPGVKVISLGEAVVGSKARSVRSLSTATTPFLISKTGSRRVI